MLVVLAGASTGAAPGDAGLSRETLGVGDAGPAAGAIAIDANLGIDALRVAFARALFLAALAAAAVLFLPVLPLALLAASLSAGVGVGLFQADSAACGGPDGQPAANEQPEQPSARRSLRHGDAEIVKSVCIHCWTLPGHLGP